MPLAKRHAVKGRDKVVSALSAVDLALMLAIPKRRYDGACPVLHLACAMMCALFLNVARAPIFHWCTPFLQV